MEQRFSGGASGRRSRADHPAGADLVDAITSVGSIGSRLLGGVAAVAFPSPCVLCRNPLEWPHRDPICPPCWRSLPRIASPGCPRCGLPYGPGVAPGRCGPCRSPARSFRRARAAGLYEGPLRAALLVLKYGGRERLARSLGRLAFERCIATGELDPPLLVVPVPLHWRRRRERGFNQAELLAASVARLAGARIARHLLRKVRARPPQTELSASARLRNAAGAYRARIPASLAGRPLLLVDDVLTTGATVAACARALARAGAGDIDVLTVARTM